MSGAGRSEEWSRRRTTPSLSSLLAAPGTSLGAPPPGPDVEQLLANLEKAARAAGIGADDPMSPLLTAIEATIRVTIERNARSDQAVLAAAQRLEQMQHRLEDMQTRNMQFVQAVGERLHADMKATCAKSAGEIGSLIAETVERTMTLRAKVLDRESILVTAMGLLMVLGLAIAGGRFWGRSITTGEVDTVVGDVQLSLGNRVVDAKALSLLAKRNPLAAEIRGCMEGDYTTWTSADGRSLCAMPVYLDLPAAPSPPPPQTAAQVAPSTAAEPASPSTWALPGAPPTGPVKFHD